MKSSKRAAVAGLAVPVPEMVRLDDVNMAAYNPRTITAAKMASLKASLKKHGMVLNLVVQRAGMVMIGGHQRVRAARELCAEQGWELPGAVPAVVLDVDDAAARQLNVALNAIDGDFDAYKLGELFKDMYPQMTSEDVLATGMLQDEIVQSIALVQPIDDQAAALEVAAAEGLADFGRSITLSVDFDTVEERDKAKELVRKIAAQDKRKAGAVVARALAAYAVSRPGKKKRAAA